MLFQRARWTPGRDYSWGFSQKTPKKKRISLSWEMEWLHRTARRKVKVLIMWESAVILVTENQWPQNLVTDMEDGVIWIDSQTTCSEYLKLASCHCKNWTFTVWVTRKYSLPCRHSLLSSPFLWKHRPWLKGSFQKWLFLQVLVNSTNYIPKPQEFLDFLGLIFKNNIYLW